MRYGALLNVLLNAQTALNLVYLNTFQAPHSLFLIREQKLYISFIPKNKIINKHTNNTVVLMNPNKTVGDIG